MNGLVWVTAAHVGAGVAGIIWVRPWVAGVRYTGRHVKDPVWDPEDLVVSLARDERPATDHAHDRASLAEYGERVNGGPPGHSELRREGTGAWHAPTRPVDPVLDPPFDLRGNLAVERFRPVQIDTRHTT